MKKSSEKPYGTKYLVTDHAIYQKKDSIIYITFRENLNLNARTAQAIVAERLAFQANAPYPVICDVTTIKSIDEEARMYLASRGSNQIEVVALVSEASTVYEMGMLYKAFNSPKAPTEVFSTAEEAENYIKQLKKEP